MAGTLYIVSTPIGNPEDVTLRALRILREVAVVAAEDPQSTKPLLTRYAIETPVTSYHRLIQHEKAPVLIARLMEGESVALVSDAGTPVIADPGQYLIAQALAHGIRVVPVPGASALLAALSASGLPGESFLFLGSLPEPPRARRKALQDVESEPRTLILFESSDRIAVTLATIRATLGNRRIILARDLTKPTEEFVRGTVKEVLKTLGSLPSRGEVTVIVEGCRQRRRVRKQGRQKIRNPRVSE